MNKTKDSKTKKSKNVKVENLMVIVLDKHKKPLGFTSEKRAKEMLENSDAVIHRYFPFIIRHKHKDARFCDILEFRIKLDPGSMKTGVAITDLKNNVYFKATISHRAQQIVKDLESRSGNRRNRRNRKTRYRRCKYGENQNYQSNREEGWLPPSVKSIANNIINFIIKMMRYVNITECYIENVKFDFQKLENPNIKGVEYQQGTLEGFNVRGYLLEECGHTCQYCGGETEDKRLDVEHIVSKYNGGSSRISNLTIACHKCNEDKGNRNLDTYLKNLKKSAKKIDKMRVECISKFMEGKILGHKNYGAWVNSYKDYLIKSISELDLNIELSNGATTAYNRLQHGYEKEHYNDAICVGDNLPKKFKDYATIAYEITAKGRGNRLKGQPNCCGILKKTKVDKKTGKTISSIHREKTFQVDEKSSKFQTGDLCKITIKKGKYQGVYVARILIRHDGRFDFKNKNKTITTSYKNCKIIQKGDGYDYKVVHAV